VQASLIARAATGWLVRAAHQTGGHRVCRSASTTQARVVRPPRIDVAAASAHCPANASGGTPPAAEPRTTGQERSRAHGRAPRGQAIVKCSLGRTLWSVMSGQSRPIAPIGLDPSTSQAGRWVARARIRPDFDHKASPDEHLATARAGAPRGRCATGERSRPAGVAVGITTPPRAAAPRAWCQAAPAERGLHGRVVLSYRWATRRKVLYSVQETSADRGQCQARRARRRNRRALF
jgi:hypothetical protein